MHGGEVNQVAADTVNLPDDKVGKLACADAIHHGLIFWAVCVLGRVAGVFKHDVVGDAQHQRDIGDKLAALNFEGVFVHLPMSRDANIDGRLLRGQFLGDARSHTKSSFFGIFHRNVRPKIHGRSVYNRNHTVTVTYTVNVT